MPTERHFREARRIARQELLSNGSSTHSDMPYSRPAYIHAFKTWADAKHLLIAEARIGIEDVMHRAHQQSGNNQQDATCGELSAD